MTCSNTLQRRMEFPVRRGGMKFTRAPPRGFEARKGRGAAATEADGGKRVNVDM